MSDTALLKGLLEEGGTKGRLSQAMMTRFRLLFAKLMNQRARPDTRSRREAAHLMPESRFGAPVRIQAVSVMDQTELFPTLVNAILSGARPTPPLAGYSARYVRSAKSITDIVVLMDASRSSESYLDSIREMLSMLVRQYLSPSSRLGLIGIEDGHSRLLFSPTTNRRRVFGGFGNMKPGGYTKLGDALRLAEQQFRQLKQSDRPSKPMLLAISDCFPEPIPIGVGDLWETDIYKDVRRQAKTISRYNVPIIVLDPSSIPEKIAARATGRRLARYISSVTGGKYINLPTSKFHSRDPEKDAIRIGELLKEAEKAGFGHQARGMEFMGMIDRLNTNL